MDIAVARVGEQFGDVLCEDAACADAKRAVGVVLPSASDAGERGLLAGAARADQRAGSVR